MSVLVILREGRFLVDISVVCILSFLYPRIWGFFKVNIMLLIIAGGIVTVLERKALIQIWKHVQRNSWLQLILESMSTCISYFVFSVYHHH